MDKENLKDELIKYSTTFTNSSITCEGVTLPLIKNVIDNFDDTPTTEQAWEKIAEEYKLPVETVQQIAGTTISSAVKKEDIAISDGCIILNPNLTEPEKPEIPHWLAERTEEYNIDSSVKFWRYVFNGSIFDPEERAWILDNDDIINKIFLCGYTVKELAWVVKEKESGDYLVDYKLSDNDVILSSSKANAYPFKDKQQAESVATLTNNTIEERNE